MLAVMALGKAEDIQFYYDLGSEATECFLQNLQEGDRTIAITLPIKTNSKIMMMVNTPQGRELDRQMGQDELKSDFVVTNGGQHQFCISN